MDKQKSNFPKFIRSFTGEIIFLKGGGVTSFGLGVYVFNQTGSAACMAIITLLGFLPTFLFSVPAGVLADRYDRRILMMVGDGFSALGIVYILICMMQGECAVWQIGLGVFVSATFQALLGPAYSATITDLLTKEEYSRASGLVGIAVPLCALSAVPKQRAGTADVPRSRHRSSRCQPGYLELCQPRKRR